MKVLYLTKYSRNGASSRLRSYQYFPFLEDEDIAVTVRPFFNEDYLTRLYAGKKTSLLQFLGFYINRFFVLFSIYKYDRLVIEKELFPYFFSWFEQLLSFFKVKYIVDYDDAIFHNYDKHSNKIIRFFLKNKISNVMKNSHCVIAGNKYLAKKAQDSGAKKIKLLPTTIDLKRYQSKENFKESPIVIGWIGTPSTFKYVKKFEPIFLKLNKIFDIELHIIGAKEENQKCKGIKFFDWSEDDEVAFISKFDIGVMPLDNTPWELGKCSYKLIQYMGCGIPVVASAIGMNKEVVVNGENGFLVKDENEWLGKLSELLLDQNLRIAQGAKGRAIAEEKYSLQNNFYTLVSLLKDEKVADILSNTIERELIWDDSLYQTAHEVY
jgi:glycosyltransferase involved in cell wall biosynthesis